MMYRKGKMIVTKTKEEALQTLEEIKKEIKTSSIKINNPKDCEYIGIKIKGTTIQGETLDIIICDIFFIKMSDIRSNRFKSTFLVGDLDNEDINIINKYYPEKITKYTNEKEFINQVRREMNEP